MQEALGRTPDKDDNLIPSLRHSVFPALPRALPRVAAFALASSLQLLAAPAAAHIELQLPVNRYSNVKEGENKACPCGSGETSRLCNDPADFSDDNRSADRITTFAPGETITVRFDEYVGHAGRYRIAFDPDGADLGDFNQHILLDEPDPSGATGNIGDGFAWEFEITLPNMTCDNCTLQLIQVMDGNTVDRVPDPSTRGGTYFQCADIVLAEGTPPGGIAPANPGEHLAERRRPQRAPAPPREADEQAEADERAAEEQAVAAPMMAAASGTPTSVAPVASNSGVTTGTGAPSDGGACAFVPGHVVRNGWAGPVLLAAAVAALRGRRRPA